ncbi:hypothetical protein TEA_022061 [Camellia sinensis var. sinensis]|uniref:Uncharacterized protein n=1 Tax=Camellia sinensis var. sinensis TaxID=542762 RepID=A0A4S4E3A9_CAMSN|nr:hypothetical protein TEA_022061 [Camellia sinensis var. sinensis]
MAKPGRGRPATPSGSGSGSSPSRSRSRSSTGSDSRSSSRSRSRSRSSSSSPSRTARKRLHSRVSCSSCDQLSRNVNEAHLKEIFKIALIAISQEAKPGKSRSVMDGMISIDCSSLRANGGVD